MQQLAPGEFRTTRYNLIYTVPSSAEQDVRPPKCSNVQLFYPLLHVASLSAACTHIIYAYHC